MNDPKIEDESQAESPELEEVKQQTFSLVGWLVIGVVVVIIVALFLILFIYAR